MLKLFKLVLRDVSSFRDARNANMASFAPSYPATTDTAPPPSHRALSTFPNHHDPTSLDDHPTSVVERLSQFDRLHQRHHHDHDYRLLERLERLAQFAHLALLEHHDCYDVETLAELPNQFVQLVAVQLVAVALAPLSAFAEQFSPRQPAFWLLALLVVVAVLWMDEVVAQLHWGRHLFTLSQPSSKKARGAGGRKVSSN